ncbi:MAG: SsrA-binding protein SmpB [Alphaproteobacteria bacterium]|nr:SsrA-binding protein SmpB [Alphaproteobacteria bacterium]
MSKLVAQNKKARYQFFIEDTFEAGIMLKGSEVKSIRKNGMNINESFVSNIKGDIMLLNSHIAKYEKANINNHEENRYRKLLLHKREISKVIGKIKMSGYTMVPLKAYFNERNILKMQIAIAKGKHSSDKRQTIKERDWKREKAQMLKKHE